MQSLVLRHFPSCHTRSPFPFYSLFSSPFSWSSIRRHYHHHYHHRPSAIITAAARYYHRCRPLSSLPTVRHHHRRHDQMFRMSGYSPTPMPRLAIFDDEPPLGGAIRKQARSTRRGWRRVQRRHCYGVPPNRMGGRSPRLTTRRAASQPRGMQVIAPGVVCRCRFRRRYTTFREAPCWLS
jgi:hypothetical protein